MSYHYLFPSVMRMKIEFAAPLAVYEPGQAVSGEVVFECDKPLNAKIITVTLDGLAFCSFIPLSVSTRGGAVSGAKIEYVHEKQCLWSVSREDDRLERGIRRFPFSFHLPMNCPPSFEAMAGALRYQLRVEVDGQLIPNQFPFTVNPRADLNQIPGASLPIIIDKTKEIKRALGNKGEVIFKGSIPKGGFVPGEEIKVSLHVRNNSSEKFVKAELKLMQRVLLRGAIDITSMPSSASANMIQHLSDESQEIRKVAKSAEMIDIPKNSSSELKLSLRIPAVAQSFDSCAIIKLEYFLKIKIKTGSVVGPSVKAQVPIIIGTIPLGNEEPPNLIDFDLNAPPPAYSEDPEAFPHPSCPSTSSIPSPSYQESAFGRQATSKEANHTEPFAPRYPVYEFDSTQPGTSRNS